MVGGHGAVRPLCPCGRGNLVEAGKTECFRCRVSSIGWGFRGGALTDSKGFHRTQREFLMEHTGMEFEKQLAKRTDIAKADST